MDGVEPSSPNPWLLLCGALTFILWMWQERRIQQHRQAAAKAMWQLEEMRRFAVLVNSKALDAQADATRARAESSRCSTGYMRIEAALIKLIETVEASTPKRSRILYRGDRGDHGDKRHLRRS